MRRRRLWAVLAGVTLVGGCTDSPIRSTNDLGPALPATVLPPIITLRASGPDPQVLHIYEGRKVTFRNADSRVWEIYGDVHPDHKGPCPEMNLGALAPGESREVLASNAFYALCFYHDESAPSSQARAGLIVFY